MKRALHFAIHLNYSIFHDRRSTHALLSGPLLSKIPRAASVFFQYLEVIYLYFDQKLKRLC